MKTNVVWQYLIWIACIVMFGNVMAEDHKIVEPKRAYRVQAGDVLDVTVWKEKDLQKEVLIRPDGGMSFPLVGDFKAQGLTFEQIQQLISDRLSKFIPEPVVTVSALKLMGNKIFVLGKVAKPGEYVANSYVDVTQALSMAGGLTPFAAVNDIRILRRDEAGIERTTIFRYGDLEEGKNLNQNIMLQTGDVVVVP